MEEGEGRENVWKREKEERMCGRGRRKRESVGGGEGRDKVWDGEKEEEERKCGKGRRNSEDVVEKKGKRKCSRRTKNRGMWQE